MLCSEWTCTILLWKIKAFSDAFNNIAPYIFLIIARTINHDKTCLLHALRNVQEHNSISETALYRRGERARVHKINKSFVSPFSEHALFDDSIVLESEIDNNINACSLRCAADMAICWTDNGILRGRAC